MTNSENTESGKPKRTYKRKSREERKAEALAIVAKLEAEERLETMADNPIVAKITRIREKLEHRSRVDGNLVNGYGKGLPGVERIRKLKAEVADLETRMERAVAFLPGVGAMTDALDDLQEAVLSNEISNESDADFSFLTEEYVAWTETELERIARLEREARAELRGKPDPVPEPCETVADADGAKIHETVADVVASATEGAPS